MPDDANADATQFDVAIPESSLGLPRNAHVPGTGTEPDWPPLETAKAQALDVTTDETWPQNEAYIYGFALLRAGFYWEAHEVWEVVWLACAPNSRERSLMRALIQTANAQLKIEMDRRPAALRLLDEAQRDLNEVRCAPTLMGVSTALFAEELMAIKERLG